LNELANTTRQAMPAEQWGKFLAPGRVPWRGDVTFPLKRDELRKALDSATQLGDPYVGWTTGDQQVLRYGTPQDELDRINAGAMELAEARDKIKSIDLPLFAQGGRVTGLERDVNPLDSVLGYFELPMPDQLRSALADDQPTELVRPEHRSYQPPFFTEIPETAMVDQPDQPQDVTAEATQPATVPAPINPANPASLPPPASSLAATARAPASSLGATAQVPATPSEAVAYLRALAAKESGGDPLAQAPTSSAQGLYQFTDETWRSLMSRYPELKLTPNGRTDPVQQDKAIRALTEENVNILTRRGLEPTDANLYIAHFMGPNAASRFILALDTHPTGLAAAYVSPAAARANRSIFYDHRGHPRTVAEVYARLTKGFTGRSFVSSLSPATSTTG
jgi:hypothetical protein